MTITATRSRAAQTPPRPDLDWDDSIESLYEAVGQPDRLAQALGAFRPFFSAQGVMFLTIPDARFPATSHTGVVGVPDTCLLEYHAHFNVYDEWALAAVRRPDFGAGAIYRGNELVPRQALEASYFGRQFAKRYGILDILTSVVEISNAAGPTTFVTFHRQDGLGAFEADDADRLAQLVPHMRRVLRLHRRLAPSLALGQTLQQMIQRLDSPVLFLDREGQLVDGNAAGRAQLSQPASPLRLQGGRVVAALDGQWRDLSPELAGMAAQRAPALTLQLCAPHGPPASLVLHSASALQGDRIASHAAFAIATLHRPPADPAAALQQRFGLTGSEARVALQLAEGHGATEIARRNCTALSTVRTHIRAALGKCGVHRQTQLVALVLRDAASLINSGEDARRAAS